MKLTDQITIKKSLDPTWVRWAVICKGRSTEWFPSHEEAIAYARGLDVLSQNNIAGSKKGMASLTHNQKGKPNEKTTNP